MSPTLVSLLAVALAASCGQTLDAGSNILYGPLPVDERNPVILINDSWSDNWSPEYAALFANNGGPQLAGIVVNATHYWPNMNENLTGYRDFVAAARNGGMRGIPDPIESDGPQLIVPPDRQIASTKPNNSAGAQLILRKSEELSLPGRPLVILSCSRLTDIADAYLLDPTVVDRVVVVAQLGSYSESKGPMTGPNGDLDPWADWIVAQHFDYVQISVYYDQSADVTEDDVANLPTNPFGAWMSNKRVKLSNLPTASDQEPILAVSAHDFIASVVPSVADTSAGFNVPRGQGPPLVPSENGNAWLVTQIDASVARARMWEMLRNPKTFQP
ncbi:MAG: hypothetical protein JXP73_18405 [Deltaproteobacteria bacterium]|nr:hypothetical protein [Deltaproteobacteria bacterium]